MWGFHSSFEKSDLVKSLNIGREATVDTKDLAFDDGTEAEVVEDFHAVLPRVGVSVLAHIFVVITIHAGDLARFVVTSQKGDVGGVLELKAHEKLESLNGVVSAVNVVSHEDITCGGDKASLIE